MKTRYRYQPRLLGVTLLVVALLGGCGTEPDSARKTTLSPQTQVGSNEVIQPEQTRAEVASSSSNEPMPVSFLMFDEPG
jgi:hypothetical protein